MGDLIIKVVDEEGRPIPSAHFEGKSRCFCIVNCHDNNLSGHSDASGIIRVDTHCGAGGGDVWGYVTAEGYTKEKVNTGLDTFGRDTKITVGLHKVSVDTCVNDADCPEGYVCRNGKCVKSSHHDPWVEFIEWLKTHGSQVLIIGIILIIIIVLLSKREKITPVVVKSLKSLKGGGE